MSKELITKQDLELFKSQLIKEIKSLLKPDSDLVSREWLKASDVKKLLRISTNTLTGLRGKGKLQCSKIGGIYFYKTTDIERLLLSGYGI